MKDHMTKSERREFREMFIKSFGEEAWKKRCEMNRVPVAQMNTGTRDMDKGYDRHALKQETRKLADEAR